MKTTIRFLPFILILCVCYIVYLLAFKLEKEQIQRATDACSKHNGLVGVSNFKATHSAFKSSYETSFTCVDGLAMTDKWEVLNENDTSIAFNNKKN